MSSYVLGPGIQSLPYRWTGGYGFRVVELVDGSAYTILPSVGHVTFTATSGVAAYTVNLPAEPLDNERRSIAFDKAVAALTISGSHTINVTPTAASAGDAFEWIFSRAQGAWLTYSVKVAGGGGGVTDHGALTGLADDDHPQYLTQAEADVLYAPAGGGGASWTEAEIDFGSAPVYEASFTITDAAITSSAVKMQVLPCGKAATGRTADDWQWDGATFAANPGAGSATVYAQFMPGPIVGRRKVQYSVGA